MVLSNCVLTFNHVSSAGGKTVSTTCFKSTSASPQLHFALKESKLQEQWKRALHLFLAHMQTAGVTIPVSRHKAILIASVQFAAGSTHKNGRGKQGSPIYHVPAGQEVTTTQDNKEHLVARPEKSFLSFVYSNSS